MADIAWSAYALAMFTPEQRAAAVQAIPEDPPGLPPKPPVLPVTPPVGTQLGLRVGFDLAAMMARTGLNPNVASDLQQLTAAGWHFEGGLWFNGGLSASGVQGGTPNSVPAGPVAFVSAAAIPSGSVLGYTVPVAPAVLLPSWVGGRLGVVTMGAGMRPESGGQERVVFAPPGFRVRFG